MQEQLAVSSSNGNGVLDEVQGRIDALLDPLRSEKAVIESRRDQLVAEKEELDSQLRKIDKVLRAAGEPAPGKPGRKMPVAKAYASGKRVAPEIVEQVKRFFVANPGQAFTAMEVGDALGLKKERTRAAIDMLRDDGVILLRGARKHRPDGTSYTGTPPREFLVAPEHAGR